MSPADKITDFNFDHVASAKFTVNRQIKHRTITQATLSVQPEPDSPNLLRLQWALGTNYSACVPRPPIFYAQIIF